MEDQTYEAAGTAPAELGEAMFWRSVSASLLERQPELTEALTEHDSTGRDLVAVLVERGLISADDLYEVVVQSGRPELPAESVPIEPKAEPGIVYLFPATTEAVKKLQTDLGVTVDGRFGPETAKAVNEAVASGKLKPE